MKPVFWISDPNVGYFVSVSLKDTDTPWQCFEITTSSGCRKQQSLWFLAWTCQVIMLTKTDVCVPTFLPFEVNCKTAGLYNVVTLHELVTYTFPLNMLFYCVTFDVSLQNCECSQMPLGGEAFLKNTGVTKMGSAFKMIRRGQSACYLIVRGNIMTYVVFCCNYLSQLIHLQYKDLKKCSNVYYLP